MLQLILTKDDDDEMKRLEGAVATEFEIKNQGFLRYFLRMEVMRNKIGISKKEYFGIVERNGYDGLYTGGYSNGSKYEIRRAR